MQIRVLTRALRTLAATVALTAPRAQADEPFQCAYAESLASESYKEAVFFPYRPRLEGSLPFRDLEFQWSSAYSGNLPYAIKKTLDRFGDRLSLPASADNPFEAPFSDLQLIFDYLQGPSETRYDPNVFHDVGFIIGQMDTLITRDFAHVDAYLYRSGYEDDTTGLAKGWGKYPSYFVTCDEDTSPGHSAEECDSLLMDRGIHGNSESLPGPEASVAVDTTDTGWTRPDATQNVIFNHEFQHSFRNQPTAIDDEFWATAAEAIGGLCPVGFPRHDVPYTASLLGSGNYWAMRFLNAYLAYKFRGADTTATQIPAIGDSTHAFGDDLLWKWARSSRQFGVLTSLLSDERCPDCAQREPYFQGLAPYDRCQLMLHNWRVANYVNNPELEDGQYGYPASAHFSPGFDQGAWQDNDGLCDNNGVAVPPELIADDSWASREITVVGQRFHSCGGGSQYSNAMQVEPLGAEYWIVKSSATLTSGKDLVIRVSPEGLSRGLQLNIPTEPCSAWAPTGFLQHDGRLIASAVTYEQQDDSLWKRPDWATGVIHPTWVDVDSAAGALEFVVPDFGDTVKAAVVVVTLQDGPSQETVGPTGLRTFRAPLKYSVSFGLRAAPYMSENPVHEVDSPYHDDCPAWSPSGESIAYEDHRRPANPYVQIRLKTVGQSQSSPLYPQQYDQGRPDWSPRGDWVAFESDAGGAQADLWAYNTVTHEARALTDGYSLDANLWPVFQPNGQGLAYVRKRYKLDQSGYEHSLARIGLDGAGDVEVGGSRSESAIGSPRWSPDGQWIYFTRNDSLLAIPASGGNVVLPADTLFRVSSFDLPLGNGAIVGEQVVAFPYSFECPVSFYPYIWYMPLRRISLRDTLAGSVLGRFYRTGWTFHSPRWSFDNTRIAYAAASDASLNSRDIYIGQVTYDHAPTFDALRDTSVLAGASLELSLAASDPDGDSLAYSGAYRPAGSAIHDATFAWTTPSPPASYYVVLRASDLGGAVANKVVKIARVPIPADDLAVLTGRTNGVVMWTEPDQGGGEADGYDLHYRIDSAINESNFASSAEVDTTLLPSPDEGECSHCVELSGLSSCHTYYFALKTRGGGMWSAMSNVGSDQTDCSGSAGYFCAGGDMMAEGGGEKEAWSLENALSMVGQDAADLYALKGSAGPVDGEYRVRLRKLGPTATAVDQVALGVVDRDSSLQSFVLGRGTVLGTTSPVSEVRDGANADLAARFRSSTEEAYTTSAQDTLIVTLGGDSAATKALVIESAGFNPDKATGIVVQAPASDSSWSTIAHVHPRRYADAVAVDARGNGRLRLLLRGQHQILALKRLVVADEVAPTWLRLVRADHSREGDVASAVGAASGSAASLQYGDTLALAFEPTSLAKNKVRDLFLSIRGGSAATTSAARRSQGSAPVATSSPRYEFAPGPARPNPSLGNVTISYTLAQESSVAIRVYNVAGKLVRTLVSGTGTAGPHDVAWDAHDDHGARVGAGVYFYRMNAGNWQSQRKVVFLEY